jgi:hypothetical protein
MRARHEPSSLTYAVVGRQSPAGSPGVWALNPYSQKIATTVGKGRTFTPPFDGNSAGVAFPLVIPLGMEMFDIVAERRGRERSPKRITLDKHSSLTDLTQRFA